MPRTPLVILGAGGHGAEVATYARDLALPLAGAFDDGKPKGPWHVTSLLGGLNDLVDFCARHERVHYITAFGSNAVRRGVVAKLEQLAVGNLAPFTLCHRSTWLGAGVEVGEGTLLAPNSLITTRARVGRHCILNVKVSVSHDCLLGDLCNINPNATICGDVTIGEGCYIGAGATVIEKRRIGAWTVVGAGAVVTQDLPPGVVAVGVPARIVKRPGIPKLA